MISDLFEPPNQSVTGNLSAPDYSELGSPVPHHA